MQNAVPSSSHGRNPVSSNYIEKYHWNAEKKKGDEVVRDFGTAKPFILLDHLNSTPHDLLEFLLKREEELPLLDAYEKVRALDK